MGAYVLYPGQQRARTRDVLLDICILLCILCRTSRQMGVRRAISYMSRAELQIA